MSQGTAEKGENETAAESSLLSSSTALSHFQCKLLFCLRIHSNNMHSIHNCLGVFIVRSCLMAELAWNSDQPFKKKKDIQATAIPASCYLSTKENYKPCWLFSEMYKSLLLSNSSQLQWWWKSNFTTNPRIYDLHKLWPYFYNPPGVTLSWAAI